MILISHPNCSTWSVLLTRIFQKIDNFVYLVLPLSFGRDTFSVVSMPGEVKESTEKSGKASCELFLKVTAIDSSTGDCRTRRRGLLNIIILSASGLITKYVQFAKVNI